MDNRTQNELIEQFLSGTLLPADQEAVETRMLVDEGFRELVALHRELHEAFADPQKLKLRDTLAEILQEAPTPAKFGWIKGLGITLSVFFAVWLGWKWMTAPKNSVTPDKLEGIKSAPMATPDSTTSRLFQTSDTSPERPVALANPAAFKPNQAFEERLGGTLRTIDGLADMQSPRVGENFTANNGRVKIHFRGNAPASSDTAQHPLIIKIYTNQPNTGAPLLEVPLVIKNRSTATWAFSAVLQRQFYPGLYYFTLERQASADLIYVGKFTARAE